MSSCFFSSRLKMRISRTSEERKRRVTALPKEPVPPVIKSVLSVNGPLLVDIRAALGVPHRVAFVRGSSKKLSRLICLINNSLKIGDTRSGSPTTTFLTVYPALPNNARHSSWLRNRTPTLKVLALRTGINRDTNLPTLERNALAVISKINRPDRLATYDS